MDQVKFWKTAFKKFEVIRQGWTNLLLRARFFGCAILFARPIVHAKKTGAQNQTQCPRLIEKQLETTIFVLYYLDRACSFHFYCNFIKSFCIEAFAV